ncbi:YncE family protein [Chloroflexota bacterium]
MKHKISITMIGVLVLALFAGFLAFGHAQAASDGQLQSKIVVANRGSGNISVIDARSGKLVTNIDLPQNGDDKFPEPMYVVYSRPDNRVFVGDRANNRVVAFDAGDFSVIGTVNTGLGVFHMWTDQLGKQLWVNNDIDKTTTVINPRSLEVIATVPTPDDLVAQGGKPHDVIVDHNSKFAYVSVLGLSGANDYVVQFRTDTFEETARAEVGKDPHLSLTRRNAYLYVPTQNSNAVYVLDRFTLAQVDVLNVPGAHGAGMAFNGKYFYTTNLTGGGLDALFTIDTHTNSVIGSAVTSPYPVPHNLALTQSPGKLYLTHSGGTSDKVTFYDVSYTEPIPAYAGEVTVGLNPFGLAYVP